MLNRTLSNLALTGCVAALATLPVQIANATSFTLSDGNSTATFDTDDFVGIGFEEWQIDGTNQLKSETGTGTYLRTDAPNFCPGFNVVGSVPCLQQTSQSQSSSNQFTVTYEDAFDPFNPNYRVTITYTLDGGLGGSGTASLTQKVTIENLNTTDGYNFDLLQYYDQDLTGSAGDDTVQIDPSTGIATQSDGSTTATTTTTINDSGNPLLYQVSSDGDLIDAFLGVPSSGFGDLDNTAGPVLGDVEFAYQLKVFLAALESVTLEQTMFVILGSTNPFQVNEASTPFSLLGLGMALGGSAWLQRKKQVRNS